MTVHSKPRPLAAVADPEVLPDTCARCDGHGLVPSNGGRPVDCPECLGAGVDQPIRQVVRPVVVTLSGPGLPWAQVLVQHYSYGVEVSLRDVDGGAWTPAALVDGVTVTVRDR